MISWLMVGAVFLIGALLYGRVIEGVHLRTYTIKDWAVLVFVFVLLWPLVIIALIRHAYDAVRNLER